MNSCCVWVACENFRVVFYSLLKVLWFLKIFSKTPILPFLTLFWFVCSSNSLKGSSGIISFDGYFILGNDINMTGVTKSYRKRLTHEGLTLRDKEGKVHYFDMKDGLKEADLN